MEKYGDLFNVAQQRRSKQQNSG